MSPMKMSLIPKENEEELLDYIAQQIASDPSDVFILPLNIMISKQFLEDFKTKKRNDLCTITLSSGKRVPRKPIEIIDGDLVKERYKAIPEAEKKIISDDDDEETVWLAPIGKTKDGAEVWELAGKNRV